MVITGVHQWAQEAHINWELNERISLSSAGSVRNEPSSPATRSTNSSIRVVNHHHHRQRQQQPHKPAAPKPPAPAKPQKGTPVQRRWNHATDKLDRTNDALANRNNVIRELNRKILDNYDKMQHKSKASWKPNITASPSRSPADQENKLATPTRAKHNKGPAPVRKALGDKMNFQRKAGGEWSLPPSPIDTKPSECTLLRNNPMKAKEDEILVAEDEDDELENYHEEEDDDEKSVLRELNEAIDRFEAKSSHDSSWDSGVGVDLSATAASAAAAAAAGLNSSQSGGKAGTGWLRVHTGIESSLVYLTQETTAADVCRDMLLSENLALYIQYGGEQQSGRRLLGREKPLELQEQLLLRLGYREPSRRSRLGLDAELKHLVGFHVGPAAPLDELRGYSRCGYALVLKGLVFPQWKKRALAVLGSRLFLYPACSESRPEWMELKAVCCAPSRLGKLVLRVTGHPARVVSSQQQHQQQADNGSTRHLYVGFHHPWDRDLWRCWIKKAIQSGGTSTSDAAPGKSARLDMSETGSLRLPEAVRAFSGVREFFLGHNQLDAADGNLKLLLSFPELQELHLENNRLCELPPELLTLRSLTFLDLSDNEIRQLPSAISSLTSLKELILDRNDLRQVPDEIGQLGELRHLSLAGNLLECLPNFLLEMRALALTDVLTVGGRSSGGESVASNSSKTEEKSSNLHNSLYKVNLRNNQLKGNIILGNYGNLTHLDLSENSIEKLDLSALQELRSVRCARNALTELTLCGRSLVSLIAGNNKLKKVSIVPVPVNLEHLDVSYNDLDSLPEWTPELPMLRALFASHNGLTALPDRLLSQSTRLEVLHLPHNRLQALPPPRRQLSLAHLTLQDNRLSALPVNFFANTLKLKVLNLSNNRLSELSWCNYGDAPTHHQQTQQQQNHRKEQSALEKLYLTGNALTNTALDALAKFGALRVLHLAYNALDTLPESCIASWKELEELVLSGNKLHYLPDNVANLAHLRVLRVHSNRLLTCPAFNKTSSLKVLDLAHNHLDRLNLDNLLSAQLQFLDISCNSRLRVDPRQFQNYNSTRRPLSLVDVSGQNRLTTPTSNGGNDAAQSTAGCTAGNATTPTRGSRKNGVEQHLPWRLGFSETAGTRERLLVSQVRMPTFCNAEGLFGLFDGGSNQEAPSSLQEMIPRLLLEERTVKETRSEYLRYTLLSAQRELREKGQKYGVDAALVHVVRKPSNDEDDDEDEEENGGRPRYLLTAATCGEARAVLCRASGPLQLAKSASARYVPRLQTVLAQGITSGLQRGANERLLPIALPEPISEEVILEDDDEFVIIGNRRLWEVLSIQEAVREARAEANPVLAAKRLQDLGQAYGAEDNLSVIVVRLSTSIMASQPNPEPLNRLLMRELRHAVNSSKPARPDQVEGSATGCTCPCCMPRLAAHEAPGACCCHAAAAAAAANGNGNGFYLNGVLRNVVSARSSGKSNRSSRETASQREQERSSPSGQSDQTSEMGLFEPHSRRRTSGRRFCSPSSCKIRTQQQQHQQQTTTTSVVSSERSPPPSDEQLRCWEYMLEQNTQLLFDKELDTLTSVPRAGSALRRGGQSRSTPQLGGTGTGSGVPFLSRRFGSARSFDTASSSVMGNVAGPLQALQPLAQPVPVLRSAFGGSGRRVLNGGPNAAYFGSLQRLMPYNLEYDFAVIQERGALDSLEQDASRMQQYWGVATTEL